MLMAKASSVILLVVSLCALTFPRLAVSQEIIVVSSMDQTIEWLKANDWWGEATQEEQLQAPHTLLAGFSNNWRVNSKNIPVPKKKQLFYRIMLPLIMHANVMVLQNRVLLETDRELLMEGKTLSNEQLAHLRKLVPLLRIGDEEEAAALGESRQELMDVIDQALYRLDVIPAGLALGQAAYESGYGTSRFASEGNALFGQWTYDGSGLKPEQQRNHLGNHRIAAFDWPFDSVRGYFLNLSSHPAYEDFRRLRAQLKAEGKPLDSLVLADGLSRYSERGMEYVNSLKGIIRVNKLDVADHAVFRDEPVSFLIGTEDEAAAQQLRGDIEGMRASGELDEIIARMKLE
jgi:Bax protein